MTGLAAYPEYDDGVKWAPRLPSHWSGVALKWVARIYAGGTPDKSNLAYWEDGTVPWINSGAVNDGVITRPSALITEQALAQSSARWVPPGSVVIALAGQGKTKGTPARLEIASTTNQSIAAIVPTHAVEYRFVYYWLASNYQSIRSLGGGDLRDGLNLQHIGSIELPLPPLPEQTAIADYLDREITQIDALIMEQRGLVSVLGERRAALIARVISTGLTPNAPLRDSTLGWLPTVPAHWTVANIRRFAQMKTGHTPSRSTPEFWVDCTIPWFTLADVWQLRDGRRKYLGETETQISELGLANSAAELLPAGTVVLSRTASVGFSGIMPRPMATSQDFWNWVCGCRLLPEYLLWLFRAMRGEFNALMIGSTHKTIYQPVAAAIRIPVPPLDEQRQIIDRLDEQTEKIDALIAEAEGIVAVAKERRSALITAAVTGQIDVRGKVA